ncbi:MAG: HlyD family efflux transporter periplasmic adaptor subunit [Devosiaceae bacterium]|nr:HlyD family efflux transporter periplasmic adaptor subunit [Devosiaceae bacterium MH13]
MLNPDPNPDMHADQAGSQPAQHASASKTRPVWVAFKTLISSILAVAIIAGGVMGMRQLISSRPEVPQRPQFERQIPVLTETMQLATHSPTISVFGEIVVGRLVDLRALVAGEITAVNPNLEAGGRVENGASLLEIDRFSYEGAVIEAEANLAEARASLAEAEARMALEQDQITRAEEQVLLAQRDLDRAEQLASAGSLTDRDLDNRRLTLSQRLQSVEQRQSNMAIEEARLEQRRASISRLEWRLAQAQRDLERTVLRAPFTGVVRSESVEPGRLVSVNDVLATVYDDAALNVRFTLSDSQFGRLAGEEEPLVGRPITVTWSTGGDDVVLEGRVDRLDADISAATGGVALFGRFEETEAASNLRPGAFVTVQLADQAFEDTIRVPETALYNTDHVFTVIEDRLQRLDVELVAWDGAFALVRPTGDAEFAGAEIVTTRMTDAGDGVAIRRIGEGPPRQRPAPGASDAPATAEQAQQRPQGTQQTAEQ